MTTLNELFQAGGKPAHTLITSGTGTFVPSVDNALCKFKIQAGGAGGYTSLYAGGAGAMVEVWRRVPIAGVGYVVGGGGAVSTNGSKSSVGSVVAQPGGYGGTTQPGPGGALGVLSGGVDADGASLPIGGLSGVAGGGGGGSGASGQIPGFPAPQWSGAGSASLPNGVEAYPANGQGNGSGGSSLYGLGGTNGNAPASDAYGAGGGINAAGRGGCIEIEDFGA